MEQSYTLKGQSLENRFFGIFQALGNIELPRWLRRKKKNLPTMQETWVQSLGREDSLEKGMAIHSSILAWRIPQTEEPGRLKSIGSQKAGHD